MQIKLKANPENRTIRCGEFPPDQDAGLPIQESKKNCLSPGIRALLDYWYYFRFARNTPTASLLSRVKNEQESLTLCIVALLDLDSSVLRALIPEEEWQFVDECHHYLKRLHRS